MSTQCTPIPEHATAPHSELSRHWRAQRVPCWMCGAGLTPTGVRPRTMTGNISGLCDRHETQRAQDQ